MAEHLEAFCPQYALKSLSRMSKMFNISSSQYVILNRFLVLVGCYLQKSDFFVSKPQHLLCKYMQFFNLIYVALYTIMQT